MVLGCGVRRRHHDPQAVDQGCDHDHDPDPYREHHGHRVSITGVVIAAHVAGMFLSSPFSGWLVDRFGYLAIAAAAGVTLVAAGLLAAWAPVDSVGTLLLALVLLGLGWNLGLVSGTTVVTDAVPLATRARTPGRGRSRHRTCRCWWRAELRLDGHGHQLRHAHPRRWAPGLVGHSHRSSRSSRLQPRPGVKFHYSARICTHRVGIQGLSLSRAKIVVCRRRTICLTRTGSDHWRNW
jgi:hypothetical protein